MVFTAISCNILPCRVNRQRQLIATPIKQNNAVIIPLYDARELLIENVKRLMGDHPDKGSAAKLGAACIWPAGKKKGQKVGERTIRYLLDTRTDMIPPRPSPSLDLIVAIANAFNTPAWQLLVDDKQLRTWMVGKLFSAGDAATDARVERYLPLPPSTEKADGSSSARPKKKPPRGKHP